MKRYPVIGVSALVLVLVCSVFPAPPARAGSVEIDGGLAVTGFKSGITFSDLSKQSTAAEPKYTNTVVVSARSGSIDNGNALRTKLAGMTGSAAAPKLLKLEPGIYDVGPAGLQMKAYVDIEGSGESVTVITGIPEGVGSSTVEGVINGADHAELRNVTVEHRGGGKDGAIGIYSNGTLLALRRVTVNVSGASLVSAGILVADGVTASLHEVDISVSGGQNAYGISLGEGVDITIRESIVAVGDSINGSTGISMASSGTTGALTLIDSYVHAGGTTLGSDGVSNRTDYGIRNGSAESTVVGSIVKAAGADANYGISKWAATVTEVRNSIVTASGGTGSNIANNVTGGSIYVPGSTVTGDTYYIRDPGAVPAGYSYFEASRLVGAASGSFMTCAGVYDSGFGFSAGTSCP